MTVMPQGGFLDLQLLDRTLTFFPLFLLDLFNFVTFHIYIIYTFIKPATLSHVLYLVISEEIIQMMTVYPMRQCPFYSSFLAKTWWLHLRQR